MKMIPQRQWRGWEPYAFFNVNGPRFSKFECESIVALARTLKPAPGLTAGDDPTNPNKGIRSSELYWMKRTEQSEWIFDRLQEVVLEAREQFYPFHISGFSEYIQLTRYLADESGHYGVHQDFGPGEMSTRKLSLVTVLSDPADFDGGTLEILSIPGPDKTVKHAMRGTVIAFPSWELHKVNPVTRGERWSMVCWMHGPYFA
jgi:PKHD-type hydroxylase